jgi:UDP-GlcNAc:undecaprenyl-phosphate GlcNAc-1-phosphate transferase
VILHSRTSPQISEYDDGGSHVSVYLLIVLAGAGLAAILTPIVARWSSVIGLVDAPGGRKVHPRSISRLGGLAVVVAAAGALTAAAVTPGLAPRVDLAAVAPLLLGGGMVFLVGLIDDIRTLSPWTRLAVESGAAVVVMAGGLLIQRVTVLGTTWDLGWLAWPVTALWIVGLTNAFNLIDGLDGLAGGIAVIAGTTCAAILVVRGHHPEAMLLTALVGGALGFLLYNFAPASIFLGDGGSLLVGFVLAATAIAGWQKGATALAATVPILIFAFPLADAASALGRRLLPPPADRQPSFRATIRRIVEPDQGHIHHRLVSLGWSPRQVVLVLYAITLALSMLALGTVRVDE